MLASSAAATIFDFDVGQDDRLVFATGLERGAFTCLESAAFSAAGNSEARFQEGAGRLKIDQDGDGSTDRVVVLDGISQAGQISAGASSGSLDRIASPSLLTNCGYGQGQGPGWAAMSNSLAFLR